MRIFSLAIASLIVLAVAGVYAYATVFSHFAWYDDEGYMMISVQGMLNGHLLYTDILSGYGPFYYLYEWCLHSLVALPLSHDVTRALCAVHWLVASSLLATAAFRMTRSLPITLFVFLQATVHLTSLIWEPGHPQEIVVLLLALAALMATIGVESKWTLPALVAIGTALVLTKINVGAFYGFALLLALSCHMALFRSHRVWFGILLVLSSLLPVLLMRSQLAEQRVLAYAGQVCVSVLAAGTVAYVFSGRPAIGLSKLFQVGLTFLTLLAVALAVLSVTGISPAVLLESLILGPSKLSAAFSIPLNVPHCSWSGAAAVLAAGAVVAMKARLDSARFGVLAAKAAYSVVGGLLLVMDNRAQLGYLLPWTWLLLVPCRSNCPIESSRTFGRSFVCLLAVWQGLQAYPVAGTQATIATVLLVLVYSICLHDAVTGLATEPWAVRHLGSVSQRTTVLLKALASTAVFCIFVDNWCNPVSAWRYHASLPKLGLPGADHLRLPEDQADTYRALTSYVQGESDTFITVPGLNSLYFWTDRRPPTYFNFSEVVLLSDDQQARVIASLENARRPIVVLNTNTWVEIPAKGPLRELLEHRCAEIKRFGNFHVLAVTKAPSRE